jgi:putative transposase
MATMDPDRRSIRLKGYDYSGHGAYFVTLCAHRRRCFFGTIMEETVRLNAIGQIVQEEWLRTAEIRSSIVLSDFVVMPNHLHGIIVIMPDTRATHRVAFEAERAPHRVAPTPRPKGPAADSIGAILTQFKSMATKRANALNGTPGADLWQRNYYEHIIRDEDQLGRIREYIVNNPRQWAMDRDHPDRRQSHSSMDTPWLG